MAKIRFDEDDVHKFVERLRAGKINGAVESLKVNLNSETRFAESILWTYRGARQLAVRCGDVAFWDSSHSLSR